MPILTHPRRVVWGLVVLGLLFVLVAGVTVIRAASGFFGGFGRPAEPQITQAFVLERLQDVAKLVATEMVLRDVVIYEQTRFHSTKRSLLVASGRVSAGINLRRAVVQIDDKAKRINVTLPPAEILSVEVLNVTTYDEHSGLLNPFTTADRDLIQYRIRMQLRQAGTQSRILEHADESAAKALTEFLKVDGYTVKISRPITLEKPTG